MQHHKLTVIKLFLCDVYLCDLKNEWLNENILHNETSLKHNAISNSI